MLVNKSREVWRKCRLCMRSDVFLIFLFESSGELTNLANTIKELLQYEVSKDDKYPSFVCSVCSDKLWEFKDFKEKCDKTKNSFEAILSREAKHACDEKDSLLDKRPLGVVEEVPCDTCPGKRLKLETFGTGLKKCISLPKQPCVKEEEIVPESSMENYETSGLLSRH